MNVAVVVFRDFIAPRFDCCSSVLVEEQKGSERSRRWLDMEGVHPCRRARLLKRESIDVLLCGGICRRDLFELQMIGIKVIPFLKGKYNDVLNAYYSGKLNSTYASVEPLPRMKNPGDIDAQKSHFAKGKCFDQSHKMKGIKNDNNSSKWKRWNR